MPMQGATDTLKSKVKFPKERTEHGTVTQTVSATSATGQSLISFSSVVGIANGYVLQAYSNNNNSVVNVGNNTVVTSGGSGILGFDQVGPTVVNVQGTLVTVSRPTTGPVNTGQQIVFSRPLTYKPNTSAVSYNANTYLATVSRKKNANSVLVATGSHQGWQYISVGTGFVKAVQWKNAGNQASNGYINFYANTQYDPAAVAANASLTVNANGGLISITVNNGGKYQFTPFANVPFTGILANTANAVLTVIMGGRANRIQVETLSVTSNAIASDPNSGGIWYPGT